MSEISGDTMTTLELHNSWRLLKSKHSGVSSKTRLFPKPVGRFTTVSLPDRTNESACCYCGSMLMSALPMCCRESRIVEERLSLSLSRSWSLSNAIFLYNMERRCTYYYATQAMNTVDQHLGQGDLIGWILRNRPPALRRFIVRGSQAGWTSFEAAVGNWPHRFTHGCLLWCMASSGNKPYCTAL